MARVALPLPGDFSLIKCELTRRVYEHAWSTIHSRLEFVYYMIQKPIDVPWAFIEHPTANEIIRNLKLLDEHCGCSVALTMRNMETIMKKGWTQWCMAAKDIQ